VAKAAKEGWGFRGPSSGFQGSELSGLESLTIDFEFGTANSDSSFELRI
jgi:hypothetical protein